MKIVFAAAVLLVGAAFAAEKECAAVAEDGTVIHAVKYQVGKLSECRDAVKAEIAKTQCKPGDKKVKFQFRVDTTAKPSGSSAPCPPPEAAKP